jgi:hypothetical protein
VLAFAKDDASAEETARMRLPTANGAGSKGGQTAQPVASRSKAPAAVPMPGPAAATPPPWNRVPGQEPAPVLVENRPTETVEDSEGPTAFLEPPPPPDERTTGRAPGFVLDFVGIFEKLEKALAFDSKDVEGVVEGLDVPEFGMQAYPEDANVVTAES